MTPILLSVGVVISSGLPALVAAPPCHPPTVDVTGRGVPADVPAQCQHSVDAFDNYSWQAFLSVSRAASSRGQIDPGKALGTTTVPLVFETYKALWEIFRPDGGAPGQFAATPSPPDTPCPNSPTRDGELILSAYSKLEDVRQFQSNHLFDGPLVAQNGTVIRYATGYNRKAFEQIVRKRLFLTKNLGVRAGDGQRPSVEMPLGSIAVKSAWMILKNTDTNRNRYRWRRAWVRDLFTSNACTSEDVALVGLHIIQKTSNNPQWIWSTFEHVDNLRPIDSPEAIKPFALHDGTAAPMPPANPNPHTPAPGTPLKPFNVDRVFPISTETQVTNTRYAAALNATGNVVWQNYRLVMTQWPRSTGQPQRQDDSIPGGIHGGFPTSFANPAFETMFQNPDPTAVHGCMNCHNRARDSSDYLWTPVTHSFSVSGSPAFVRRTRIVEGLDDQLRQFLEAGKREK